MSALNSEFVLLRDGGQALIRSYEPADRTEVAALFSRLSPESRAMRFHTGGLRIDATVIDTATTGHVLVAERAGALAGLASYIPLRDPTTAETAITVDDSEQGRGIGPALFERLSTNARRQGILRLLAEVMSSNSNMFGLLQGLGFHTTRTYDHGGVEVAIDLQPGPEYIIQADVRRHVAAVASLEPLLRGYRGAPATDIPAVREVLLRIAQMVEDIPEVAELDINPVVVRPMGKGAIALDARLRLSHLV